MSDDNKEPSPHEGAATNKETLGLIGVCEFSAVALILIAPLAGLGYRSYVWLKTGDWPTLTFIDVLAMNSKQGAIHFVTWISEIDWFGVQKGLLYILGDLPVEAISVSLGALILLILDSTNR